MLPCVSIDTAPASNNVVVREGAGNRQTWLCDSIDVEHIHAPVSWLIYDTGKKDDLNLGSTHAVVGYSASKILSGCPSSLLAVGLAVLVLGLYWVFEY